MGISCPGKPVTWCHVPKPSHRHVHLVNSFYVFDYKKHNTTHATTYTMWKAEELLDAIRYRSSLQEELNDLDRRKATIQEEIKKEEAKYRRVANFGNYKKYVLQQLLGSKNKFVGSGFDISQTDAGGTLEITDISKTFSDVRDNFKNDEEMKPIELESFLKEPMHTIQVRLQEDFVKKTVLKDNDHLVTS